MNKKSLILSLSLCLSLVAMPSFAGSNDVSMIQNVGVEVMPLSQTTIEPDMIEDALISFHTADSSFTNTVTLAQADTFIPRFTFVETGIADADDIELRVDPLADGVDMTDDETLMNRSMDRKVDLTFTMPTDYTTFTTASGTVNRSFYNQLVNTGYLTEGTAGTFAVDSERLANNIRWRIWADQGIQDLSKAQVNYRVKDLDTVESTRLSRLGDASLKAVAGAINLAGDAIEAIDGDDNDVSRLYVTNFDSKGIHGDVLLTSQKSGDMNPETDLMIKSIGMDLNGKAHRVIDQLADGTLKVTTAVNHALAWGAEAEILEERFINSQGIGVGHGVLVLTDNKGVTTQLPLRTLTMADGRLVTQIGNTDTNWIMNEDVTGAPVMQGVDKIKG